MHVLHLSAVTNWGGGENHIENLCFELKESNPEIKNTILCARDTPFHKRLEKTDLNFITAPLKIKVDPRYFLKIGRFCKKEKVDLIHIHEPSALFAAILADKLYNLPPFVFSKKTSFPIKQRKKTLYKYNYAKIKKILCVSDESKRVAEKAIVDKDKLLTIYHGTNLKTKSTETPFLLKEKYNINGDKIIIGNIGNHIKAKHLETWIDVADNIINKKKNTDFIFVQIGTFSERTEALIDKVKSLNLESFMIFVGYQPNASNFISQFDISLITSQSEGIPQFIYESMYHKTPVISTDVGGITEAIEHDVYGLIAPVYDSETLTEHIFKLSKAPQLQKEFTKKSHEKLLDHFTTSNMAKQTLNIYKTVLNYG
ncbi:glycosyltransferase family 4 protein [Flavivirga abyssicola]|uniref:glycosyltransferase family 4 protein n=1 Tax=Flavivirga abyssicola TaxID=3063533 RepID=UPI0026DF12AE|nr:glycosyltransferase family 4 protein [Flavivirga sp. MEBiC07777]WVK12361.1 glycosyltransferase family 4 protein [Flavivirga sp. MEBiC07777]